MKLEQAKARVKTANKVALEAEKEKDVAEKTLEELKRQLQPKRSRTDDDAGEALCQKTIQLLVQGMVACARVRTWIPVEWPRKYLLPFSRDDVTVNWSSVQAVCLERVQPGTKRSDQYQFTVTSSREKGSRYCCEGAEKDQTWSVGVHTGSRSVVI